MRYDDDLDFDDFDIEDRHSHAKNRNRKVKRRKAKRSVSNGIFAFVLVLIVLVLLAVGCMFGFRYMKPYMTEPLEEKIQDYEMNLEAYDAKDGDYLALLEKAKKTIKGNNLLEYYRVSKEIDEATNDLKTYKSGQKVITDLKEDYMTKFANYRVTDKYKSTYDDIFGRLNDAIKENDQSTLSDLKKELRSLEQNLKIENENLIQSGKNEINHLGLSSANPEDNIRMEQYKTQVNDYIAEGNYAAALDMMDEWKALAGVTAERIAESESKAKAMLESNRQNHEQEEIEFFPSGYVFPDSSTRNLTTDEIIKQTGWGRKVALYEIYARHGCRFTDETLQNYFDQMPWYQGTVDWAQFDESQLNEFEAANVRLLNTFR